MEDFTSIEVSQYLAGVWGKLMTQGQYNGAMFAGLLGYFISLETQDTEMRSGAIALIRKSAEEILQTDGDKEFRDENASTSCSFCGRKEPEVRLVAGASAAVCDSCVARLAKFFSPNDEHGKQS